MKIYQPTNGGGGGGTVTGADNGLSLSGTDVILGGSLIQSTTIEDTTGTFPLTIRQDQDGGSYASDFTIGTVLPAFGGLNGIGIQQGDGTTFNTFTGIADASGLGGEKGTYVMASNNLVGTESALFTMNYEGGGMNATDGALTGDITVGTDNASMRASDVNIDEYALFQVEANGGAGSQYARIRYHSDGSGRDHRIDVNSSGVTFDFGTPSYTFPTGNGTGALTNDGSGNLSWSSAGASLTDTYIGYGDSLNQLTGSDFWTFNDVNRAVSLVLDAPWTEQGGYMSFGATIANPGNLGPNDITVAMSGVYASSQYGGNLTITIETSTTFGAIFTGSDGQTLGSVTGITVANSGTPYIFNDNNGHPIASIYWAMVTGRDPGDSWTKSTNVTAAVSGINFQNSNGINYFRVNPVSGTYWFGDGSSAAQVWYGNGNHIEITDALNTISIGGGTSTLMLFETDVQSIRMGDLATNDTSFWVTPQFNEIKANLEDGNFRIYNGLGTNTYFDVSTASNGSVTMGATGRLGFQQDGTNNTIKMFQTGNNYFYLDYNGGEPYLAGGDLDGTGNNTRWLLQDSTRTIALITGGDVMRLDLAGAATLTAKIGDTTDVNNKTKTIWDDANQSIMTTNDGFTTVADTLGNTFLEINPSANAGIGDLTGLVADASINVDWGSGYGLITIRGAEANPTMQPYMGGADVTILNGYAGLYYDPASLVTAATITMPANPIDGQEVEIYFGGTITGAATPVVTTLTIAPNSGQTLVGTFPVSATTDTVIRGKYRSATSQWFRAN